MAWFRKSLPSQNADAWTPRDEALVRTLSAVQAVLNNNLSSGPRVLVPFALRSGHPEEHTVADSPYRLWVWQAVGDGSYIRDQSIFFATGRGATGFMVGSMAGQMLANSSRANQAARDAQPRWVLNTHGQITVSDYGFYLHTSASVSWWPWGDISLMELTAPATVQMLGQSTTGPVRLQIDSNLAELLFCFWALACNPQHPQFTSGTWIPDAWVEKVKRLQGDVPCDFLHEAVLRQINS